jgi:hypothetical protein
MQEKYILKKDINGNDEYHPCIIDDDGKIYDLIGMRALLLACRDFRFSTREYCKQYGKYTNTRKSLRVIIGHGKNRKKY